LTSSTASVSDSTYVEDSGHDNDEANNFASDQMEKKGESTSTLRNQEEVCDAINVSRQTGDYQTLMRFFTNMYSSFEQVLHVLKVAEQVDSLSHNLNMEYLDYLHESMIRMPKDVRKSILRAIINCMLQDHRGAKSQDDIRGFLVFVLNPLFSDSSTYVIYAHVLRQICVLDADEQQIMITWLRQIPSKDFQGLLTRLRTFVNYKLFPTKNDIPAGEKSAWWIPNGVKVMALLNAANDVIPILVPRKNFYVKSVESLDLVRQYHLWESGSQNFSFCQYPFCLPLSAKRLIIQKDSETKMLLEARQSLLHKFRQKQLPNMGLLFLNLRIRRKFLLEDSLREISRNQGDLKKKLRVQFTGEPGIDLGGVSKEWFFLITQRFFNEDYGMFTYNSKSRQWWFCTSCKENNQEYNLCGVLLGLAMYNGINLDIRFPMAVYKKLLSPAIVPYNNPHQPVGIAKFQMNDFTDVFPELGRGLKELLEYDGNVEEDLCQTFMVSFTEYGQMLTRYLRPDGDKIPVTNANREEYVNLYINYMMNKSIYKQFYSFYHGFHSVCASNALLLLRPEEVETLVIGDPDFNMSDLEKITTYDGYQRSDPTIRHFWEAVHDFNLKLKRKFLRFCTGNDRIPVGGMKEMKFKITKVNGVNATHMLPTAHTCFNQLCLPPYKSRKLLLKKLMIAVENAEGFGLE
jgi:E3 ubiquitin-protein ligase HECTD2